MALTSRRRRPLDRSQAHLRDTRLIIIAAEGRRTESRYFGMFRSTRVQVKVLSADERNLSAPEYVLDRLRQFRDDYQLAEDDALWLMVDVDRWGDAKLAAIAREAQRVGFGLAISNPCFEVWLLYHCTDRIPTTERCDEIEAALRLAMGGAYNKANPRLGQLAPHVSLAAERAEAGDPSPRGRWPSHAGSHVYRVIRSLPDDVTASPSTPGCAER